MDGLTLHFDKVFRFNVLVSKCLQSMTVWTHGPQQACGTLPGDASPGLDGSHLPRLPFSLSVVFSM